MATGRTLQRWGRFYVDGYDWSGRVNTYGPLGVDFEEGIDKPLNAEVQGVVLSQPEITIGNYNATFANNATNNDIFEMGAEGVSRVVMIAQGIRAEPAQGDPAFVGKFPQKNRQLDNGNVLTMVNAQFSPSEVASLNYVKAWGTLLHAKAAKTGANTGSGVDNAAATTGGGYLVYQVFAYGGTGSATISIEDSADGVTWLALSGATTGAIAHTSMPTAGIVQLATTATVRRYLRWQLSLTTLTSVTFALAFVRG